MKEDGKNFLFSISLIVFVMSVLFIGFRVRNTNFEERLEKMGLTPTEVKYIYEDKDGNIYHCVPASAYRQEVIERM